MSSAFLSAAMLAQRRASSSDLMAGTLVEIMGGNHCTHRIGNEIADAPALGNPLANFCGRNVPRAANGGKIMSGGVAGPLEDDKLSEREQIGRPPPFRQIAHVILADEVK